MGSTVHGRKFDAALAPHATYTTADCQSDPPQPGSAPRSRQESLWPAASCPSESGNSHVGTTRSQRRGLVRRVGSDQSPTLVVSELAWREPHAESPAQGGRKPFQTGRFDKPT